MKKINNTIPAEYEERSDIKTSIVVIISIIIVAAVLSVRYFSFDKNGINVIQQNLTYVKNITYQDFVCHNLEKLVNVTINNTVTHKVVLYPEIINRKNMIDNNVERISYMDGNKVEARTYDKEGVMCEMMIEVCDYKYIYCMDLKMIIPVNYTEFDAWINN